MSSANQYPSKLSGGLTRRRFMQAGVGVTLATAVSACGSSAANPSTPKVGATALTSQLQAMLGKPTNLLAKGPGDFNVAGQWPLTGAGMAYGKSQGAGWEYGVRDIEAWTEGKLKFRTHYYDNQSGVPQAEAAAGRQAGLSGVPVLVNSYIFGFGATIPFAEQYKMFSPDPGGGTGPTPGPFSGKPYCYGFRAPYPTGPLDGLFEYVRQTFPGKKKWVTVQPVISPAYNNGTAAYMENLYGRYNIDHIGEVMAPFGATDYSATVTKIKQLNPDVVIWTTFGTDPAYQAVEMQRQGVTAINAGNDFTPQSAQIAGSAYKGWYFGFDYLNTVRGYPSDRT